MCTVSFVAAGGRLRAMCNRDERYTRPAAHPPLVTRAGGLLALLPLDPCGGGTWIAGTSAGLVFAVLNGEGPGGAPGLSRGRLILELLESASLEDAVVRARPLCSRDWPAHRLLVADADRVLDLRVGLAGVQVHVHPVHRPQMFTSSSLGDAVAGPPRRALFDETVVAAADPLDGQDAFHRHRWRDRPHLSVHMRRHDAATLSITTVDVSPSAVRMRYEPATELVSQPAMVAIDRRADASPGLALVSTAEAPSPDGGPVLAVAS
ncbi:MAG: NRDE family protein [Vicinamibacterales bacterium]